VHALETDGLKLCSATGMDAADKLGAQLDVLEFRQVMRKQAIQDLRRRDSMAVPELAKLMPHLSARQRLVNARWLSCVPSVAQRSAAPCCKRSTNVCPQLSSVRSLSCQDSVAYTLSSRRS
jgi:ABC-type arginine transport system ATPase subunit